MSTLKSIFECKICHNPLSECVIMPCGESICQKHTLSIEKISCPSCKQVYKIPKDGFPWNKIVNLLFETNIHKLDMGKKFLGAQKSLSKLGSSIKIYDDLIKYPSKFVKQFFDEIFDKLACKRDEFKLENDTRSQNLIFELKFSRKNCLTRIKNAIESYLVLANSSLNCNENIEDFYPKLESKINSAKYVIDSLIDQEYDKLLAEYKLSLGKTLPLIDNFKPDEKYDKEIEKAKSEHQKFVKDLTILKTNEQIYSELKKNIDSYREIVNQNVRLLKDSLLMNKGFELESKLFYFPNIKNDFLFKWKNEQNLELDLKDLDKYTKKSINGDRFMINGISFSISLKLEEDNFEKICCFGGLSCSNNFYFCAINVEYSMQLNPIMDKPIVKKSCIKCFSPGYCKLATLNRYCDYSQKDFKLHVNLKIVSLRNRNMSQVSLRTFKTKSKKCQKVKSFGQSLIRITGPDFDLDYQPE